METKLASFKLNDFFFPEFSFNSSGGPVEGRDVNIGLNPVGKYNNQTKIFDLVVAFVCKEGEKEIEFLKAGLVARFEFEDLNSFEEIPEYFYQNSLAIIFPYIRAFISTMTLQANIGAVILPLLNLTELKEVFKSQTTETPTTEKEDA